MRLRLGNIVFDESFFLISQIIISITITFFTIINQTTLTSVMFTLSFINLAFLYITSYKNSSITMWGWRLLAWCVLSILLSYLTGDKNFILYDLVSFGTFAATILYLQIVNNVNVTKNLAHLVLILGTASAVIYPIGYYFLNANEYRIMGSLLLTMHFSSPNLTGTYLAQACLFSVLCFIITRKKIVKIIVTVVFVLDFYFLYQTGARNSLIAVIVALIGIVFVKIRKIKKINHIITFLIAIAPLVFAIMYLLFINTIETSGYLSFIIEEGKPITSRLRIWNNALQTLKGFHWIIGDYSKLRGNLHNTHITILGSYGIVGISFLIKYLTDVMNTVGKTIKSPSQLICLICFFGTIIMGFGEAALFYGSMGMYAIACSYLILARYDWESERPVLRVVEALE